MNQKKNKKVSFRSLKAGAKFRYKRRLYVKDVSRYMAVRLSNGSLVDFDMKKSGRRTLVTFAKVTFRSR